MLNILKKSKTVFQCGSSIIFTPGMNKSSNFFTVLLMLVIFLLSFRKKNYHSILFELIFYCVFIYISIMTNDVEASCVCDYYYLHIFFREMSVEVLSSLNFFFFCHCVVRDIYMS